MTYPAFRCADCVGVLTRCAACRARRAKSIRDARAAHESAGLCTDCSRVVAIDVSTGETRLQCDAHLAANARRSAAAKRRVRDVLTVVVMALACASSIVACEPAVGDDEPTYPSSSLAGAAAPSSELAGRAAPEPVPAAPEPVVTVTYDAGPAPESKSPVEVAGSPAPSPVPATPPVAGSPSPTPPAPSPEPTPAPVPVPVPTVHPTQCKLDVGGVVDCNNENFRTSSTFQLQWTIDPSKPATGANSTGCIGASDGATKPQCVPGSRCVFLSTASDYFQQGTCQ